MILNSLKGIFNNLKAKILEYEEELLTLAKFGSMILLSLFIIVGLIIGFIGNSFKHLLFTTLLTWELVFVAAIFKFENKFVNSVSCTNFVFFFFLDPFHLLLAMIQLLIIFSRVRFSKHGITFGFTFWLVFVFLYDNVYRVLPYIPLTLTKDQFLIGVFLLLLVSAVLVYLIKHYRGCLINGNN